MILIVACTPSGGIGYLGSLPWTKINGDLPRFKSLTSGQVVVMGSNTWDSLPLKPLSNRLNIVVSSRDITLPNGSIKVSDLNHFSHYKNAYMIGGAKLINSSWQLIDKIHLTTTYKEYPSDTYIDLDYIKNNFVLMSTENNSDHTYQIFERFNFK